MNKLISAAALLIASSVASLPATASVWHGSDEDSYETSSSKSSKVKKPAERFDPGFEYSSGSSFGGGSDSDGGSSSSYKSSGKGGSSRSGSSSKSSGSLDLEVLIALLEFIKSNPDLPIEDIIAALKAYVNGGTGHDHGHGHGHGHHGDKGGKGDYYDPSNPGTSTPVPLPAPILLFGSALLGLFGFQKINRKS